MVTQTRRYRVSVLTVLHSTYVRQRANFLPSALVTLQREQIQVGKRRGAQRYYRSPNKKRRRRYLPPPFCFDSSLTR